MFFFFFISTDHNNMHKHIWIKNTNKKKTSKTPKIKFKVPNLKQQLNTTYMFMQHGFKIDFLNPFYAWTCIAKLGENTN